MEGSGAADAPVSDVICELRKLLSAVERSESGAMILAGGSFGVRAGSATKSRSSFLVVQLRESYSGSIPPRIKHHPSVGRLLVRTQRGTFPRCCDSR